MRFTLKISDLLSSKKTDVLDFENVHVSKIPNLDESGISGTLTLHSLDGVSLLAHLENLQLTLHETCDRCTKEYERKLNIDQYTAKFILPAHHDQSDTEEEILFIDEKNGLIDVEELIFHAVLLQEPFVKYCDDCEKLPTEDCDLLTYDESLDS